ncbi:MAG: TVP38/TMEM64 family protein, partial [Anaerolineae bacterium]
MNQTKNNRGVWIRTALLIVLVVAAIVALWYWHEPLWQFFEDQDRIQAWIQSFGPWAPLISIALNAAQVLAAPIPGQIIG